MNKVPELRRERSAALTIVQALADKPTLSAEEQVEYMNKVRSIREIDANIERAREVEELSAAMAKPVAGQERDTVPASVETDPYIKDRSLILGGIVGALSRSGGNPRVAREAVVASHGERHPLARALTTNLGAAGGMIVPPDYMPDIVELLRSKAVVRNAGPRTLPMPNGTMTMPGQASAAVANYGAEGSRIQTSQQSFNQINARAHKLTALVPFSNDLMRFANPAIDGILRDDLVKVIGLREDLAFLFGDGTADTPRGFVSFANDFAVSQGGTSGVWLPGANSTAASGGNFITSNETYTLATVAQELGGLINRIDTANVPEDRRMWFFHPRTFNYLNNVQNSLGVYVYRDELSKGTLLGYPFRKSTQFPINIYDATGTNTDCSFVILAEMTEAIIFDSLSLELMASREGTYIDGAGNTIPLVQYDQTLIRAITMHDFQVRHTASVAIAQFVRWAPAIS